MALVEKSLFMSEEFDWQKRSKEYNERNNIIFKGDMNDKREFDTFFNTLYQPKEGQNIGILGEKYLILLQEKNKSEKRPEGQFLIDPDLMRDVLDCMGYDRTDVISARNEKCGKYRTKRLLLEE